MTYMISRNRVQDFERWRAVFASHADAHRAAGLHFTGLWRDVKEPDNFFFMFRVESIERAEEFIHAPESAQAGADAGVIDGEYHFVEEAEGY